MHFVTHEMRTPLTAIQGSSELIGRYAMTEEKRKQMAQLINSEADLQICGEAGSAMEAISAIAKARPDIIIADISMPGRDGLALIKEIKSQHRQAFVLVLSMHEESVYAERVLRADGMESDQPHRVERRHLRGRQTETGVALRHGCSG